MRTIPVSEDCFDEEFFVPGHLTREYLDLTSYDLFFFDIQKRELFTYITLVLDIARKICEEIAHSLNPHFVELLDIAIRCMEEALGEEHVTQYSEKPKRRNAK